MERAEFPTRAIPLHAFSLFPFFFFFFFFADAVRQQSIEFSIPNLINYRSREPSTVNHVPVTY